MLSEATFQVRVNERRDLTIIIDANESAAPYQRQIAETVGKLLRDQPPSSNPRICFLGSSQIYPGRQWSTRSAEWLRDRGTGISLIAPVLRAIGSEAGDLVVLGAGPIFDLEDWLEGPAWHRRSSEHSLNRSRRTESVLRKCRGAKSQCSLTVAIARWSARMGLADLYRPGGTTIVTASIATYTKYGLRRAVGI